MLVRAFTSTFFSAVSPSRRVARHAGMALLGAVLAFPSLARAVDTVEPFGKGASDLELYFGGDGLGRPSNETSVGSSFQLGYGLTDRLSAYLNGAASSDTFFRGGGRMLRLGLYGTVVDTRFFDLDLFFDFRLMGNSLVAAGIAPGLEMNLDLGGFGLFATAWEVVSGRDKGLGAAASGLSDTASASVAAERVFDTELGMGAYWTIADGHQLLAFYDSSVHHTPETGQRRFEVGAVRLGYNVVVHEGIELINEVSYDIPQGDEKAALGVSTGILVALE